MNIAPLENVLPSFGHGSIYSQSESPFLSYEIRTEFDRHLSQAVQDIEMGVFVVDCGAVSERARCDEHV